MIFMLSVPTREVAWADLGVALILVERKGMALRALTVSQSTVLA